MFEQMMAAAVRVLGVLRRIVVPRDVDAFDRRLRLRRVVHGSDRWRGARWYVGRSGRQLRVFWIGYGFLAGHWASARSTGPG
jgi:hypothetical protein